ncbi:MAG: hypothetical protein GEU95_14270 [Rhizobiales bacterium]|nr:hypothetical protein [Hyphomicrobiales bacterium]
MTRTSRLTLRIAIAAILGASALMVSEQAFVGRSDLVVTTADARIGRPLTPLSYAGVARRTTRRAVIGGAAVGYGAAAAAPRAGCVQVVDAYGRIITRCY